MQKINQVTPHVTQPEGRHKTSLLLLHDQRYFIAYGINKCSRERGESRDADFIFCLLHLLEQISPLGIVTDEATRRRLSCFTYTSHIILNGVPSPGHPQNDAPIATYLWETPTGQLWGGIYNNMHAQEAQELVRIPFPPLVGAGDSDPKDPHTL